MRRAVLSRPERLNKVSFDGLHQFDPERQDQHIWTFAVPRIQDGTTLASFIYSGAVLFVEKDVLEAKSKHPTPASTQCLATLRYPSIGYTASALSSATRKIQAGENLRKVLRNGSRKNRFWWRRPLNGSFLPVPAK